MRVQQKVRVAMREEEKEWQGERKLKRGKGEGKKRFGEEGVGKEREIERVRGEERKRRK